MFEVITLAPSSLGQTSDDIDSYDPLVDSTTVKKEAINNDEEIDPKSNVSGVQAKLITFDHKMNILADPGWDGVTDLSFLDSIISKIDLIILSQTTIDYLGAYAYLLHKYPILKKVKTYATFPIAKLGRLSTIELYRSVGLIGAVQGSIMDVHDIESSFNSIIKLNYSQSISLQEKLAGITITAFNSGHTLGGSVWLLNKEAEKVIYAPVWNHSKDLFLRPCKFLGQSSMARPTTFLTGTDFGSSASHRRRIDSFLQLVELTLYNGTSLLIPTTLTGRLLEILPFLDQKVPREVPFYLLAYTGIQSLKSSANMLEWMSPDVTKDWENQNRTPFDSTRIQLITEEELSMKSGPKIVFVESLGFEKGSLARSTFIELCSRQNTALLLTERPKLGTMMYDIYNYWEENVKKNGNLKDGSLIILNKQFSMSVTKETPLRGQELNAYLKNIDEKQEKRKLDEEEERKKNHLLNNMIGEGAGDEEGEDSDEDEDEDENEDEEKTGKDKEVTDGATDAKDKSATTSKALAKTDDESRITPSDLLKMPMDFDIRNVKTKKNKMFPFIVDRFSTDDYGMEINHDDFKREEEKLYMKREFEDNTSPEMDMKRPRIFPGMGDEPMQIKEEVATLYSMDPKKDPVARKVEDVKVNVRCGLAFIDMSGFTDLRSWKFNTNGLKPRKVVLLPNITYSEYLGGSLEIIKALIKQQHNRLGLHENGSQYTLDSVHSVSPSGILGIDYIRAKLNQNVDLGNVISSYLLRIDDQLDTELAWQVITGGYSISHIIGEVAKAEDSSAHTFKLIPSTKSIKTTNNKISIGDIKLNDLRHRLSEANHTVKFKGEGTLVVDNQLAVRKISDGNLVIDGGTGELFYKVRSVIQNMLAYV